MCFESKSTRALVRRIGSTRSFIVEDIKGKVAVQHTTDGEYHRIKIGKWVSPWVSISSMTSLSVNGRTFAHYDNGPFSGGLVEITDAGTPV